MAKKRITEVTVIRAQVREEAAKVGISEDEYIRYLEKVNGELYNCDYRIDVVDEWQASPSGYEKAYKMKYAVKGKNTVLTGVPVEFIRLRAKINNMTIDEFISKFEAVVMYDESREYMTYRFRRIFGA